MQKAKLDSIFLFFFMVLLILYLSLTNSNFELKQVLPSLAPLAVLGFLSFYPKTTFKINFLIFLVFFSILFYTTDTFVDWTGYLLTTILAIPLALLSAFILKVRQERGKEGIYEKSFVCWLHKKKPALSVQTLFILSSLLNMLISGLLMYFLFPVFTILLFFICLLISLYFSFSETYFYLILPKKDS